MKKNKHTQSRTVLSDKVFMIGFLVIFALCFLPFFLKKVPHETKVMPEPEETIQTDTEEEPPGEFFTVVNRPGLRLHYDDSAVPELTDEMIKSLAVVLYDRKTNTVLYRKNSQMPLYPASTTKILTACTALKYLTPDTLLKVGSELELIQPESSLAYLHEDSSLTLEDALYALLLPSGNDAAYVIAVNTARAASGNPSMPDAEAVKYFSTLMNEEATEAGADSSNFCVPDGYHNPEHYTTAEDMLKIAVRSAEYPLIAEIVSKPYRDTTITTGQQYWWENGNCLVTSDNSYYLPFATGLKTGFTDEAGYCMVATASEGSSDLIAVILKAESLADRYTDAAKLFWAVIDPEKLKEPPVTTPAQTESAPGEAPEA